jgi:hypothetical protein
MARKVISNLHTRLTASSTEFSAGLARAEKSLQRWQRQNRDSIAELKKMGVVAGAAAAAVAYAFARMTKAGLANVDALAKQADTLGLTINQLQAYQRMAQRAGIAPEQFSKNLERMIVNLSKGGAASGKVAESLAKLGLSLSDLDKLGTDERLKLLADRMQGVASESDKVRIAFDLFGKEGIRMLRILNNGADGLRNAERRAAELGLTMSRFDAAKVEAANDAFGDVRIVLERTQNMMASQFAPMLLGVSEKLVQLAQDGGGFEKAMRIALDVAITGAALFGDTLRGLEVTFKAIQAAGVTAFAEIASAAASAAAAMPTIMKPKFSWKGHDPLAQPDPDRVLFSPEKMRIAADAALEVAAQYRKELADLLDQEMPSTTVANWYAGLADKIDAVAQEAVNAAEDMKSLNTAIAEVEDEAGKSFVAANSYATAFADALSQGLENAAKQGKIAIGDLAKFILSQLMTVAIRAAILNPLFASLGASFGGFGTSIGTAFLGAAGQKPPAMADGGRAGGGNPYMIGERGPELFVPDQNGTIVPNHKLGGGSTVYNIDMRGASLAAVQELQSALSQLDRSVEQRAVRANLNWRSRQPEFA